MAHGELRYRKYALEKISRSNSYHVEKLKDQKPNHPIPSKSKKEIF